MPNWFMPPSSSTSDPDRLLATVQQTLASHAMISVGDRILVGVSGGPDSMTLLHLLNRLTHDMRIQLGVAHLNHCLRGHAAEQDAALVQRTAAAMNLPCHMGRAQVANVQRGLQLSLEDAARRVRYAFFHRTMRREGYNKLALGHHQNDNAEQVLMALLRGSGPRGLCGIAPVKDRRIIRPLIEVRREAIEAYVTAMKLPCARDESNRDPRFVRNRIRHRLLPSLAEAYNPRIHHHLNQLADIMRNDEAWLNTLCEEAYATAVVAREQGCLTLGLAFLRRSHPALTRRLVRRAIEALCGHLRRITFYHIAMVIRLLADGGALKELHLPGGLRVRRNGEHLVIQLMTAPRRGRLVSARDPAPVAPLVIALPFPACVEMPAMGIGLRFRTLPTLPAADWKTAGRQQAFFDLARLSPPLVLRSVRPGDRFTPLGATGSQKLKKFFIDHHISPAERTKVPILTDQERILWLVGHRTGHFARLTPTTQRILAVEFFLLDTR